MSEEDTFNALKRTRIDKVINLIYAADPHGSFTFNTMNDDRKWKVNNGFDDIIVKEGWSVDEFNYQLHKLFSNE